MFEYVPPQRRKVVVSRDAEIVFSELLLFVRMK